MSEDFVRREEYSRGQSRIHERIDEIAKSVIRQESISQSIKESADKIFVAFYGNGRDGMITKVGKICTSIKIHFRLIMLCFGGILTTAFFAIRSIFVK